MSQNQYPGNSGLSKPPISVMRRNSPFHMQNVFSLDSRDDNSGGVGSLAYAYANMRNGSSDNKYFSLDGSFTNGSDPLSSSYLHSKQQPLTLDPKEFPSLATPRNPNSGLGVSGSVWTQLPPSSSSSNLGSLSTASLFPGLSGSGSQQHPNYSYTQQQFNSTGLNFSKNFMNSKTGSSHYGDSMGISGNLSSLLAGSVNGPVSEFSIAPEDFPALPSQSQPNTPLPVSSSSASGGMAPHPLSMAMSHLERSNESQQLDNDLRASASSSNLQRHGSYSDTSAAVFLGLGGGAPSLSSMRSNSITSPSSRPLLGVGAGVSQPSHMIPPSSAKSGSGFTSQHFFSSTAPPLSGPSASTSNVLPAPPGLTLPSPGPNAISSTSASLVNKFPTSSGASSSMLDSQMQMALQQQAQRQQQQQQDSSRKMRFLPNGVVENVPTSMLQDEFGLCALGYFIPSANHITPGEELKEFTNFVGSKECSSLYQNLQSPLLESFPGRPQDMDWVVPEEYHIRHMFYKQLADLKVQQLSDDTLFWIFYNCCGEDAQAVAAKALYTRDWRYNVKTQLWLTRIPGEPRTQHMGGETSLFSVWEPRECRRVSRRLCINYTDLDAPPDMCCDKFQVAATMSLAQAPPRPSLLLGTSSMGGLQQQQQPSLTSPMVLQAQQQQQPSLTSPMVLQAQQQQQQQQVLRGPIMSSMGSSGMQSGMNTAPGTGLVA